MAGFLLQLLLPLRHLGLALAAAFACAAAALACLLLGHGARLRAGQPLPGLRAMTPAAALESSSTAELFGHAFAMAALLLASFAAGAGLATALGP